MTTDELKIFEDGFRSGEKKAAARAVEIIRGERKLEREKENPDLLAASEVAIREIAKEYGIEEKV